MATRKRPALRRDEDEPDIELEVFEDPLDRIFPRLPNVVSRREHRAIKIKIRIGGKVVIPPTATRVRIDAEVVSYGPERIGRNRHVFRHRLTWGTNFKIQKLPSGHKPPYPLEIVVQRDLGDDHIGEGPYDAIVKVTPDPVGPDNRESAKESKVEANVAAATSEGEPRVILRFLAM